MKLKTIFILLIIAALTAGCISPQIFVQKVSHHLFPEPTPHPPQTLNDATVLPKEQRPNIILIETDDLDVMMGSMDYMPWVNQLLAQKGMTFEDFFVSLSLCCPSRATILRGQFAHNHQVYVNEYPGGSYKQFYQLNREESTMATWLQSAGYYTAYMGKYLNHFPIPANRMYIPPGWTEWYVPAKGRPYTEFNYALNENGKLVEYGEGESEYLTDVLTRKALTILDNAQAQNAPLFLYINPYAPHIPFTPAPRHANLFPNVIIPRTPAFNESDVSDKPAFISGDLLLDEQTIKSLDEDYRMRLQSLQAVDEMVKALVEYLDKNNLWDNTYIIFSSDNGYHLGYRRQKSGKTGPYEEDMRVPFIVRGPGIPENSVLAGFLAGNVDIAPTIADLAGVVPPDFVDGRSLTPLLFQTNLDPSNWRQAFLFEFYGNQLESNNPDMFSTLGFNLPAPPEDILQSSVLPPVAHSQPLDTEPGLLEPPDRDQINGAEPPPRFIGLRMLQYVYIEYGDGFKELYDLKNDPYQLENLAFTADPAMLAEFSNWLQAYHNCTSSSCRQVEESPTK